MSGYKGKHRRPTHRGRNAAIAITTGALAFGGSAVFTSSTAHAGTLDDLEVIAGCESGNRNVESASPASSASGYWQIIDGTWRANGGAQFASRAIGASKAQQKIVAERIVARAGSLRDWNASKACWGSKLGRALPQRTTDVPRTVKPRQASPHVDTGRAADGSGSYTCDRAHLSFNACDPSNLGSVVQYPHFNRATGHVTPVPGAVGGKHRVVKRGDTLTRIAAQNGTNWHALYAKNRGVVGNNPNLILPGQNLAL